MLDLKTIYIYPNQTVSNYLNEKSGDTTFHACIDDPYDNPDNGATYITDEFCNKGTTVIGFEDKGLAGYIAKVTLVVRSVNARYAMVDYGANYEVTNIIKLNTYGNNYAGLVKTGHSATHIQANRGQQMKLMPCV